MATVLTPVDEDPFAAAAGVELVPVDDDPFANDAVSPLAESIETPGPTAPKEGNGLSAGNRPGAGKHNGKESYVYAKCRAWHTITPDRVAPDVK